MPPLKIGHDGGAATPGRDTPGLPEGRSLARFGRIDEWHKLKRKPLTQKALCSWRAGFFAD
jgi:hypothetical protein